MTGCEIYWDTWGAIIQHMFSGWLMWSLWAVRAAQATRVVGPAGAVGLQALTGTSGRPIQVGGIIANCSSGRGLDDKPMLCAWLLTLFTHRSLGLGLAMFF